MLVALCYATGPLIANRKLGDLPGLGHDRRLPGARRAGVRPARGADLAIPVPSAAVLASLAGLGVVCTALAFVLFFQLITEVGPARATVITYMNPAVAVTLGVACSASRHAGDRVRVRADPGRVRAGHPARPAPAAAAPDPRPAAPEPGPTRLRRRSSCGAARLRSADLARPCPTRLAGD